MTSTPDERITIKAPKKSAEAVDVVAPRPELPAH